MENNPDLKIINIQTNSKQSVRFLNNTRLESKEAYNVYNRLRELVVDGTGRRDVRLKKAAADMRMARESTWTKDDIAEFSKMGVTPYDFKDHRAILNNLLTRQRENRFSFSVHPTDKDSFKRHQRGLQTFIEQHGQEFATQEEAVDYYNEVADDNYAEIVSAHMNGVRKTNNGEYVETDTFENGLITGLSFLKAVRSKDTYVNGGISFSFVPDRAVVFDESSVDYELKDIEYIGEVRESYVHELQNVYPETAEQIGIIFNGSTNLVNRGTTIDNTSYSYEDRYQFGNSTIRTKISVVELYIKGAIEQWVVTNKETGEEKLVDRSHDYNSEDDVYEQLKSVVAADFIHRGEMGNYSSTQEVDAAIATEVLENYSVGSQVRTIWYRGVMAEGALLEWGPSPFEHRSHPYARYSPEFSQGYYNSFIGSIRDVVIGLNKAYMFQELLMGASAKGLLVVDESVMLQSGYTPEDITDAYTRIGGLLVLKLKPGQKLPNALQQLTTTGQGLQEMSVIAGMYERKLMNIAGITPAQMGQAGGETPTGRYRLELQQGQQNNGVLYDNFVRTLKYFYSAKVLPLIVGDVKRLDKSAIRSEEQKKWIQIDLDDNYDLFVESVLHGEAHLELVPMSSDPQQENVFVSQLMQLALSTGNLKLFSWAIRNSTNPERHRIARELMDIEKTMMAKQMDDTITIQQAQQMALESGISVEQAEKMVTKMKLAAMQQQTTSSGQGKQMAQGAAGIQRSAKEDQRLEQAEQ